MGAYATLNGVRIGEAMTTQFVRYRFPVPPDVWQRGRFQPRKELKHNEPQQQQHTLSITFDPSISTNGRFMACSGGWDWAPYTRTGDDRGSRVFTFGITDHVYLVQYTHLTVVDVVPRVYYQGSYPRTPMWQGSQGDFLVQVNVHFDNPMDNYGDNDDIDDDETFFPLMLLVQSNFSQPSLQTIPLQGNETHVVVNLTASSDDIELWWPNGMGKQPLYLVKVALAMANHSREDDDFYLVGPWIERRIGFRTLALVTANDTDDAVLNAMIDNQTEGSGHHGMFFRINGAAVWCRGANVIPMDQLEGRTNWDNGLSYRLMVRSAAMAQMNMLRVWGGGTVLPPQFYDACDEMGILIYHDLMFVEEDNHGAVATDMVKREIIQIVQKLSAHVSIVLWNGCNECDYFNNQTMEVYESFVMKVVAEVDDTRPIWPSSPSPFGWSQGVNMLDGRPNGKTLKVGKKHDHAIEVHGPYQHGYSASFPGVNGGPSGNANETAIPPSFLPQDNNVGPSFRNLFVSEFGASVFSSFESMSPLLPKSAWSVHGGEAPDTCVPVVGNENACNGTNAMAER